MEAGCRAESVEEAIGPSDYTPLCLPFNQPLITFTCSCFPLCLAFSASALALALALARHRVYTGRYALGPYCHLYRILYTFLGVIRPWTLRSRALRVPILLNVADPDQDILDNVILAWALWCTLLRIHLGIPQRL